MRVSGAVQAYLCCWSCTGGLGTGASGLVVIRNSSVRVCFLSVQSLCIHFQSYSGNMRAILAGHKEMFPDLDAFAAIFVDSFQRLHADATRRS